MLKGRYIVVIIGLLIFGGNAKASFNFNEATIQLLNDLNTGDSTKFCSHFLSTALLNHLGDDGLETIHLNEFSEVLKKFKLKQYREEFSKIEVTQLETGITYVDVSFSFFIDEVFAFAGIDHVIWVKQKNGDYKIASLYTGVLKPKFSKATGTTTTAGELDMLMNKWHRDVANFEFNSYFDFMHETFVFLGTDPTERWTKSEFEKFCKPYFDKKSTWDFKPNYRNWYFSEDRQTAWFEESIDTWMEECRASGVLIKTDKNWKIAHYNLTVLIENDKIKKFIHLRKK